MNNDNPFSNNRAEYMKEMWKYFVPNSLIDFDNLRPIIIEGGRGTGKTTLFLCNCWREIYDQNKSNGGNGIEVIIEKGILGIYYKVDPVFVSAMRGSYHDDQYWNGLFNTYFSIEVLKEIFSFLIKAELCGKIDTKSVRTIVTKFCQSLGGMVLNDKKDLVAALEACDNYLDMIEDELNGNGDEECCVRKTSPGTIIKNVVEQIRNIRGFENLTFKIYVDEFESLSKVQQRIINTLIKRSNNMLVYSVGVKTKGIKSFETIAEQEILQETHDYTYYGLDTILHENYKELVEKICQKRLYLFKLDDYENRKNYSEDISVYLGEYSFDYELTRFKKRNKPEFYAILEKELRKETSDETIISVLCKDADPLSARLHLSLLLRNEKYRPTAKQIYENYIEYKSKAQNKNANIYREWEHNTKTALLFLLAKEYKIKKMYFGYETYVALSSGTIRNFLELCEQAFDMALQNGYSWDKQEQISPELQTRAANYVSGKQIKEIESFSRCGRKMMIFTLALGNIFQELHRNSDLSLGEPEPNHFSIDSLSISANVKAGIDEAVKYSILQELPETKEKSNISTNVVDYHLNKIFAPFFEISYLKKRKLKFPNDLIERLMSDSQKEAENAVKEYLKNYWKNKKRLSQDDSYEQLTLF